MKKFSKEFNGYNKREVNEFLNDVLLIEGVKTARLIAVEWYYVC